MDHRVNVCCQLPMSSFMEIFPDKPGSVGTPSRVHRSCRCRGRAGPSPTWSSPPWGTFTYDVHTEGERGSKNAPILQLFSTVETGYKVAICSRGNISYTVETAYKVTGYKVKSLIK